MRRACSVLSLSLLLVSWLTLAVAPAMAQEGNLIRNGQLDSDDLSEFLFRPLTQAGDRSVVDSRGGLFTEDLTWNRCYRIDLDRYVTDKEGKQTIHAQLIIGGARGGDFHDGRKAFEVEPETTYEFSLEMRGTVSRVGAGVIFYRNDGLGYDNRDTTGKTTLRVVQLSPDWTVYRGEFTTHADSRRASLRLSIYTHERYGLTAKPDTYLLVDNIVIRKKQVSALLTATQGQAPDAQAITSADAPRAALASRGEQAPVLDGKLDDAVWQALPWQSGFTKLASTEPAGVQTRFKLIAGPSALHLAIACDEPNPSAMRLNSTQDGPGVYSDDSIELFIDNGQAEKPLRQFIVNAKGLRQMTWGMDPPQPGPQDYQRWSARTAITTTGWTAEIEIPYEALGLDAATLQSQVIRFNLCRNRHVDGKEHSSWSPVKRSFHDRTDFALLVVGSLGADLKARLAQARQMLTAAPVGTTDAWKTWQQAFDALAQDIGRVTDIDEATWRAQYARLATLESQAAMLRLGSTPFAVTVVSPQTVFEVPYLPEGLAVQTPPIKVQAAINEFESLPVVITNLTDQVETYRVVLFGQLESGIELPGLAGANGQDFPAQRVRLHEAVRVKDGDQPQSGQRFDALPRMNAAQTVMVPPRESAIVWVTFDCRDAQPGDYTGTLRVIPLSQPGEFKLDGGWKFTGQVRDTPVALTVWPITLPSGPVMPGWLMGAARNKAFFNHMFEYGHTMFEVSPWSFPAQFDDQGRMTSSDTQRVQTMLRNHLQWASEQGVSDQISFVVGFSAYRTFNNQFAKKRFPVDSPAWRQALGDWLKLIERTFAEAGIPHDKYIVEMWDEPHRPNQEEVVATLRLSKEVCPQMKLTITLGASMQTPEEIAQMARYADDFCIWGSYWNNPAYAQMFDALRQDDKTIGFYYCDTSLRVEPYRYYRLHAWRAWHQELDFLGMYKYMTGPGGHFGRGSWKATPNGGLAYNASNEPVSSIRLEVLREGMDDIKYLHVLKQTLDALPADRAASALAKEARAFLEAQPTRVVGVMSHQSEQAELARQQAATYIMQLSSQ